MAKVNLWRRFFRRTDLLSESIERAVEAQARWEKEYPVRYDVDVRRAALVQRAERHFGGPLPAEGLERLAAAAAEWAVAAPAAEQTR